MDMDKLSRRSFNKAALATGVIAATVGATTACTAKPNVIVVGGGFGGATAARYVKAFDRNVNVTLIEPNKVYHTCPFSNAVLGGVHDMAFISHTYDGLRAAGVTVVHAMVNGVDATAKTVTLSDGVVMPYDRLIVSPGIDFRFDMVEGYDAATAETMPHAWKAGAQTTLLRKQLESMEDGGVFVLCPPDNPFRCPPGPYERISMVAHYFKTHKPKSKILVLDPKEQFSKQGLFEEGWASQYGGMIERLKQAEGKVVKIDAKTKTLETEFGDKHKGAVINFIPNQKAGALAHTAGLVKGQWCEVDATTWESKAVPGVHVVGDASVAGALPKSGYAANSEAKACAAAVVALLNGKTPPPASYINTCYSLVTPTYGISVANVYDVLDGKVNAVKDSGGVSPKGANADFRAMEAMYAVSWYENITRDVWNSRAKA